MQRLISAGQVLVGPIGESVPDGGVLVDENAIVAVGPRDELERVANEDAPREHHPDATLLPGLVNCHVHLAFDGGSDPLTALSGADDHSVLRGMAGRARQLLDCGVTTARDLGDRDGLAARVRDSIADGEFVGPRLLAATVPLTSPGGHCAVLGGEVADESAARERVRRNVELGADLIKVMASGGEITPDGPRMWESQFGTDELRAIVEEARAHGLPVAAHAHGVGAIASAVRAGVHTVEHCSWLEENFAFEPSDEVAKEMATRDVRASHLGGPNWRGLARVAGAELADRLHARAAWLETHGVSTVLGTDAGLAGSPFDEVVRALEVYEHVGFSRARIIELATSCAAETIGLGETTGRLAPGLDADLLLLNGDPLADLGAFREVELVLARGRQHR